jgi:hypothetical protein
LRLLIDTSTWLDGGRRRDLVRLHSEGAIGMRLPIDCEHTLNATMGAR